MTFVPVLIAVWVTLVVFFFAVRVYVARVTRDEEDQIVLSDSSSHIKVEQEQIVERIHKLAPLQRVSQILVGAATLAVIGYFVLNIIHQFDF